MIDYVDGLPFGFSHLTYECMHLYEHYRRQEHSEIVSGGELMPFLSLIDAAPFLFNTGGFCACRISARVLLLLFSCTATQRRRRRRRIRVLCVTSFPGNGDARKQVNRFSYATKTPNTRLMSYFVSWQRRRQETSESDIYFKYLEQHSRGIAD
ncbi:hypothetical protein NDU88_003361 [Pleurodeles waltl]|uniref:Uncharacterized protein n=1 Tax=Pleurodeles waltl TaxID=8319 RepID=A0AAV7T538_PLEWA|nr:hypothetical protein NDU88_003361 [Pleurodeles waltl]